jgi:hypothetical protein
MHERRTVAVNSYLLLYNGPATPPDASHEGWPEWFQRAGDKLVDLGSPMARGFVVDRDGTTSSTAAPLNGYSIVRAEDTDDLLELVRDHPFLAGGPEYRIEIFEVRMK